VSVSALVFSAESSFGVDLATTVSAGTTYQAAYNVPAGRSGWLQWGNWGFGYSFKNGYFNERCRYVLEGYGAATSPRPTEKGSNHGLY
jgi:hypothetical protein